MLELKVLKAPDSEVLQCISCMLWILVVKCFDFWGNTLVLIKLMLNWYLSWVFQDSEWKGKHLMLRVAALHCVSVNESLLCLVKWRASLMDWGHYYKPLTMLITARKARKCGKGAEYNRNETKRQWLNEKTCCLATTSCFSRQDNSLCTQHTSLCVERWSIMQFSLCWPHQAVCIVFKQRLINKFLHDCLSNWIEFQGKIRINCVILTKQTCLLAVSACELMHFIQAARIIAMTCQIKSVLKNKVLMHITRQSRNDMEYITTCDKDVL